MTDPAVVANGAWSTVFAIVDVTAVGDSQLCVLVATSSAGESIRRATAESANA